MIFFGPPPRSLISIDWKASGISCWRRNPERNNLIPSSYKERSMVRWHREMLSRTVHLFSQGTGDAVRKPHQSSAETGITGVDSVDQREETEVEVFFCFWGMSLQFAELVPVDYESSLCISSITKYNQKSIKKGDKFKSKSIIIILVIKWNYA